MFYITEIEKQRTTSYARTELLQIQWLSLFFDQRQAKAQDDGLDTQTTKRRPPQGLCAILPLSYYTRALECRKNEAKKCRLPSVAPRLTCGVQGHGFEPRRRLQLFSALKLTNVMSCAYSCLLRFVRV